jgi:hypothetical protein
VILNVASQYISFDPSTFAFALISNEESLASHSLPYCYHPQPNTKPIPKYIVLYPTDQQQHHGHYHRSKHGRNRSRGQEPSFCTLAHVLCVRYDCDGKRRIRGEYHTVNNQLNTAFFGGRRFILFVSSMIPSLSFLMECHGHRMPGRKFCFRIVVYRTVCFTPRFSPTQTVFSLSTTNT